MNGVTANSRVVDLFDNYFELMPASNEHLKLEVYKLRYQVYCLETGFESPEKCQTAFDTEGRRVYYEIDEFDVRSSHYLIRHRASRLYAATTRLILPDKDNIDAPFPIEIYCDLSEAIVRSEARCKVGEISRYAISKEFKKRAGESGTLAGVSRNIEMYDIPHEQRVLPHLSMALFAGLVIMSRENGILYWYAVMEPALLRLMHRYGIHFKVIGPVVDYHGTRVPCVITVDEMLVNVKKCNYPIWELITGGGKYI